MCNAAGKEQQGLAGGDIFVKIDVNNTTTSRTEAVTSPKQLSPPRYLRTTTVRSTTAAPPLTDTNTSLYGSLLPLTGLPFSFLAWDFYIFVALIPDAL